MDTGGVIFTQTNVDIWKLNKNNVGENKYFMTTNNITKTIDTQEI